MSIDDTRAFFEWWRLTSYLFGRTPFAATISLRVPLISHRAVVDIVSLATACTANISFSRFPSARIANSVLRWAVPH